MSSTSQHEVTQLLAAWGDGDQAALDKLIPLVHEELHRIAHHYMRQENPDHTLQTTALVNEAYLRLVGQRQAHWHNRTQFFAIAAQMMRRILVDHARGQIRAKRGGGVRAVALDESIVMAPERAGDLVALDDALKTLATIDSRKIQIVELRYFGGLTVEETAEVLGVAPVTVMRDWSLAKAWLLRELER
ncbi:MAG: sigma-70 family RNA polymerase sigma factor [Acidobacteriota bacterium]|nr:sigma-70 family RNA polymerase sigma factor [Acidobacteriota bacterium]